MFHHPDDQDFLREPDEDREPVAGLTLSPASRWMLRASVLRAALELAVCPNCHQHERREYSMGMINTVREPLTFGGRVYCANEFHRLVEEVGL
jgi:hypothetical protein